MKSLSIFRLQNHRSSMLTLIATQILIVSMFILTGCSGGGSSSDDKPASSNTNIVASNLSCDAITTTSLKGAPLTRVSVTGLSGADESSDWVTVVDAQQRSFPTALYGNETDGYEILLPLHPEGPQGGDLTLEVTDGNRNCPGIPITVEPLPRYAGDPMRELVAALSRSADQLAEQFGAERSVLAATPLDQLDPGLVPLAVLIEALDAFDADTELAALSADELAALQGLLATFDLADLLNTLSDDTSRLPSAAPVSSAQLKAQRLALASARRAAAPEAAQQTSTLIRTTQFNTDCTDLGSVSAARFGISSPEELADYIEAARGAADSIGPLRRGISDMNSGFAMLGLVPGGGWATAGIGLAWGWGSYAVDLVQQMRANLYPSSVTHLTFQVDENQIPEDWEISTDGMIKWNFAKLYATNKGMNLSRAITDGTLNVASSAVNVAGAAKGFLSQAQSLHAGAADIAARSAIDNRLNELEKDPDAVNECWNVGVTAFGPIVVDDNSGDQWVQAQVMNGNAISVDDRKITPVEIGAVTLRVETNTDNLPGPRGFGDQPVEVLRKAVRWLPTTLFVKEIGREETVKVRFDNSKHFEEAFVLLEPGPGISGLSKQSLGDGLYEVSFTTSSDRDLYPLDIKASSTSGELIPVSPERSATLRISTEEEITLSPIERCVASGESIEITATVSSVNLTPEIDWDITSGGGLLAGTGELVAYTAPSTGSGQVTIEASLAANSSVKDEVTFNYGACVELAVFYNFSGNYVLPEIDPGCATYDEGSDDFLSFNDNLDADSINPERALTTFWGPGQDVSFAEVLFSSGVRGTPHEGACSSGSFPVDVRNTSTIAVTPGGDTVNYTIDLEARAVCSTFLNGFAACSSAETVTSAIAVYQLAIDKPADYKLEANIVCSSKDMQGFTNISVAVLRFDTNEQGTPINIFEPVIFDLLTCDSNNTINYSRIVNFATPDINDSTDRVVVQFSSLIGASVNPEEDGIIEDIASMDGFVRVTEVSE